ncbi:MAG: hypothetical protein WCD21_15655 [Streptomyces sp.]
MQERRRQRSGRLPQQRQGRGREFTGPARKNTREIVILQGKFVATPGLRDNSGSADATQDLGVLAEAYAQRLRQASQGETPTATAANATVQQTAQQPDGEWLRSP